MNALPIKTNGSGIVASNPIALQALGLCPALAVSNNFFNALGLVSVTLLVLLCSSLLASLLRNWLDRELNLASFIVLITTLVSIAELLLQALLAPLAEQLGPFLPLIIVNCLILGRMMAFARNNKVSASLLDALSYGFGFAWVLLLIALLRELFGAGSLSLWTDSLWPEQHIWWLGNFEFRFFQGQIITPLHADNGGAPLRLLQLPAGALLLLAYISGLMKRQVAKVQQQQLKENVQ